MASSDSPNVLQAFDPTLMVVVTEVAKQLLSRRQRLCTAESCTGGLIAAHCTELSGSSEWFERGYVTYSNAAKHEALQVPEVLIERHGAVSQEVALAMAIGARSVARTDWSIAVTGVAGPTGGSPEKPVGTVWLAWAGPQGLLQAEPHFFAQCNRQQIRLNSVQVALRQLLQFLQ